MNVKTKLAALLSLVAFVVFMGAAPLLAMVYEKYEEKFEKTVSLARDGKVSLGNISGDIEVMTWNKNEVKILAVKTSKTDSEEQAQKNFEKVVIEILEEGNTLRINTKYEKNYFNKKNRSVSVSYWLTIPDRADADMKSVSGDVMLEDIGGDAKADTVSGDVVLRNVVGTLKGKTISGDVEVANAQKGAICSTVSGEVDIRDVVGNMEIESVSGDVKAQNCQGNVVAKTVSGGAEIIDISGADSIKVGVTSGNVQYRGNISESGTYLFKSHSGDITLTIPGNSAFDLEAKTFSGKISTDFDITISGKLSKKSISGTANGGGADLEAKTFSGNVYLKKR